MTPLWTAAEAAEATGGKAFGDWQATGLSIDTRSIQPGDLFIALKDQRDGHDFVADALAKGAAAALVAHRPRGVADDAPLLMVEDVQSGLEALGRAGRARTRARVIAVTGSVGKTSTKEMLRATFAPLGRVHAAEKSFNNHWGVPLTLARCPVDADFAVIEIGMNHPGEIAPLAALAAPDVALVTIVAEVHLEAFPNGLPAIAHEKAAIFSGLKPGGWAVFNGDLEVSGILSEAARAATDNCVSFGALDFADVRLSGLEVTADSTLFTAHLEGAGFPVRLNTPGRHFALNALGALACVAAAGGDVTRAIVGLSHWTPPGGRGTRETVDLPGGGSFALLDDAYNANPTSVGAALETLAASTPKGARIAVLGDMLELGPDEAALHAGLAAHPAMEALDRVHCVGPRMKALHKALPEAKRGHWCKTAAEMAGMAPDLVRPGDIVLVKGSFGSRVGQVVDALRKIGDAAPQTSRKAN
ncbi:UDP-N-acetylmuramoyl-tripeptide--D-alanyl-D-alanine ligase [Fluviibacterium sp. S390]|uniref:UDP-N-acetylmuramoyl-tripeptide--D-alanyl-D- alanine ligase n=1 Tax=Fluviibacterium sp. S390 TaxID=3415139 RepID=UPI003C7AD4BD